MGPRRAASPSAPSPEGTSSRSGADRAAVRQHLPRKIPDVGSVIRSPERRFGAAVRRSRVAARPGTNASSSGGGPSAPERQHVPMARRLSFSSPASRCPSASTSPAPELVRGRHRVDYRAVPARPGCRAAKPRSRLARGDALLAIVAGGGALASDVGTWWCRATMTAGSPRDRRRGFTLFQGFRRGRGAAISLRFCNRPRGRAPRAGG